MPLTSAAAQHANEEHADDEHPAEGGSRSHQQHTAGAGSAKNPIISIYICIYIFIYAAGSATPVANWQFGSGGRACSSIKKKLKKLKN